MTEVPDAPPPTGPGTGRAGPEPATGRWIAHDTAYGLSASARTSDSGRGERLAPAPRAGRVWINTRDDTGATVGVGGLGRSGYGREPGLHAVEGRTGPRAVRAAHRPGW
ncbi:aldehyde dehydrogenase family protein [Streptomyces sp. NPDC006863]|uniref:aldehyde dehydrogenase family protein n=1 Tax=unclassified Streptomyces TaxID=2593676 RepID=UPI0033D624B8